MNLNKVDNTMNNQNHIQNIILFSHKEGQKRLGVDKSPNVLKSYFHKNSIVHTTSVSDNLKNNLDNLYHMNSSLSGLRVNIGGDHSMSIATVADSISKYPDLKVIWMDAHGDINTYDESHSKNYHGMPLGILTGLEKDKSLNYSKNIVNFDSILYLGIRDLDKFEQKVVENNNIKYITVEEINSDPNSVVNKINNFIGNSPVHFSFDVDVLDPDVMPSTGTAVPNGVLLEPCKIIVDGLQKDNLVSVDITELNLMIGNNDEQDKSLKNLLYLFNNYVF